MLEDLAEAIKNKQYQRTAELLQDLSSDQRDNPWILFYQARLAEGLGNLSEAQQGYRQLLGWISNPQLLAKIRRGLERIKLLEEQAEKQVLDQRKELLEVAKSQDPELGVFVLDPITSEQKQEAANIFGEVMQIDAYSARLQLPSRAWRLYRTGSVGALNFYVQELQGQGIPCFCVPLTCILSLRILPVYSLEAIAPNMALTYRVSKDQRSQIDIPWSAVSQRVEGLLPIFEECVAVSKNGKVERKTKILDYAKMCDLHIPKQNIILRFCDQIYEFDQGISLITSPKPQEKGTSYDQWQRLLAILQEQLPTVKVWNEFKLFAETALDFKELLKLVDPHIHFLRREETEWDEAFHLYSSLAFFHD
jgi:tetratricopeptide (TPR) repeat protein